MALPREKLRAPVYKDDSENLDRLALAAGIQEVGFRKKLSRKRITPHSLRHSHIVRL
jgi:site-specific recombinase XerD